LNFRLQKSLKNQYLSHSESKSYQINSIKSSHQHLSNNTKITLQFLQNIQLWFNLIFSEEIIQYLRTFAPQVQTSWNQRHQEQDLKHPNSVDLITTKQNKLPSFIDRLFLAYPHLQRLALEINVLSKEEKIFKKKTLIQVS
jgi:hypothetical protein